MSAPITWDEVHACSRPADLVFLTGDVLERVTEFGDLLAGLTGEPAALPASPA